jgi:hypothetical protein
MKWELIRGFSFYYPLSLFSGYLLGRVKLPILDLKLWVHCYSVSKVKSPISLVQAYRYLVIKEVGREKPRRRTGTHYVDISPGVLTK